MLLATLTAVALVGGVVAGLVVLLLGSAGDQTLALSCLAFAGFSWVMWVQYAPGLGGMRTDDPNGWALEVTADHEQRLGAAVERLCVLADVKRPLCTVYGGFRAQSFTVAKPGRRPQLYVDVGLLRALDDRELDAVVAHELSHIANRDAVLMTMLLLPSQWLCGHLWDLWTYRNSRFTDGAGQEVMADIRYSQPGLAAVLTAIVFLPVLLVVAPVGMMLTASVRVLSRHRELYADRCAALLTGSPAGVISALGKISGEGSGLRLPDLRTGRDEFHIIPDRRQPIGIRRIWATHPTVRTRTARLEHMERELQHARLRPEISAS